MRVSYKTKGNHSSFQRCRRQLRIRVGRIVHRRSFSRELIVYCIIGCTGAMLDLGIYVVLTRGLNLHYQFANFWGVTLGIVNNFFLNYFFNFKAKDRMFVRLVCFYSVGMFGWALSALSLWLHVEQFGVNEVVAKLGTIVFVTIVQFCLNKFVTFGNTKSKEETNNV